MDEAVLLLLYPGSSLSALVDLGETEVRNRFEAVKAVIRRRLDGSAVSDLQKVQAQVLLIAEIENVVLTKLASKPVATMQ